MLIQKPVEIGSNRGFGNGFLPLAICASRATVIGVPLRFAPVVRTRRSAFARTSRAGG
jgi:hypothetical protein